jgi:hypothetical protein
MTSFKSIKTDVANAGAKWEDAEVVLDQGVITPAIQAISRPFAPRSWKRSRKVDTPSAARPDDNEER